jgi:predicted esterase
MKKYLLLGILLGLSSIVHANEKQPSLDHQKALAADSQKARELSAKYEKFYDLMGDNEDVKDITDAVLNSAFIDKADKDIIRAYHRKIYLFKYPSDGLKLKAVISFSTPLKESNLLIFLRGGNKKFGIPSPAYMFNNYKDYTIITLPYRDGINEGKDEFGGADVNDVKNLIDFIPQLAATLKENFQFKKTFLLGGGRGGMQLFLALSKFPELQNRIDKVVSLSGFYNLEKVAEERPDMGVMFKRDFGFTEENKKSWFAERDAIDAVKNIKLDLPILIIHGTADIRHNVTEGRDMVSALLSHGNKVSYWEIEGDGRTKNKMERIVGWLETGI